MAKVFLSESKRCTGEAQHYPQDFNMDGRVVLVAQTSVCGVPLELAEILDLSEFSVVCGPSILALGNSPGLLTEPHRLKWSEPLF